MQTAQYAQLLKRYYPEHNLYVAVTDNIRKTVFEEEAGQTMIKESPKKISS